MKGFLYFLFGLAIFFEISMTMRVIYGLEQFTMLYLFFMTLIGMAGGICLLKTKSLKPIETKSVTPIVQPLYDNFQKVLSFEDYLINSGIDINILKTDEENSIKAYSEVLQDDEIEQFFKDIIIQFLLPYYISATKFSINKAYYELPIHFNIGASDNYDMVSPSLKVIAGNSEYSVKAYPDFFYIAFPDVIKWALTKGWNKVEELLIENKEELEKITGDQISPRILRGIIDLYLKTTRCELECKIIESQYV